MSEPQHSRESVEKFTPSTQERAAAEKIVSHFIIRGIEHGDHEATEAITAAIAAALAQAVQGEIMRCPNHSSPLDGFRPGLQR